MKIRSASNFRDPGKASRFFETWVHAAEKLSGTAYRKIVIPTSLGNTVIWGINTGEPGLKPIVIFPGFRTSSLFWDVENNLRALKKEFRIYLVETNGQPNPSDGNTPDIRGNGYGIWAGEVLEKLSLEKAVIAGASFGALVCLKLCRVHPEKVEKAILLNPGCLQSFSLKFRNLYYNLLPLVFPTRKNIALFLRNAVFYKNRHRVSPAALLWIIDYEYLAITGFRGKAQKPYAMGPQELSDIRPDIHLLVGDRDILFPYRKSIERARRFIPSLRGITVLPDTGHGIETSEAAMTMIRDIITGKK